jgi:hypothetical protein
MVGQSIRRLLPADRQSEEDEILARIRAGEQIGALLRLPGFPNRPRFDAWRRQRPDFAAAVRAALRDRERAARRLAPRHRCPFDQDKADRIIVEVAYGRPVPEVLKEAGMPGWRSLARWKRERPDFAYALGVATQVGHRERAHARTRSNVARLAAPVFRRLARGTSVKQLLGEPGMPASPDTFYRWMHNDRRFRAHVNRARQLHAEQTLDLTQAIFRTAPAHARALHARVAALKPRKDWDQGDDD